VKNPQKRRKKWCVGPEKVVCKPWYEWRNEEGLCLSFNLHSFREPYQRRQAFKAITRIASENSLSWIQPGTERWTIDTDAMKERFKNLPVFNWLKGKVSLVPEFEQSERDTFGKTSYDASVRFYFTQEVIADMARNDPGVPIEIRESLERFQQDHPDPTRTAFLMMRFGNTAAHAAIVEGVRAVLLESGIAVLRADDKQYHDDLFPNVLTYIYGCGFGIAVFERLEHDDFNPNVSLEVGYMFALRKPVCLLKDKTLRTLHTDLVGKLYREFDPQNALESIKQPVRQWALDKGIVTGA